MKGGPTVRTVCLPLSAPVELAVVLAIGGAGGLFAALACGVAALAFPAGLGCDSALAF
jgi:hypothetical protein